VNHYKCHECGGVVEGPRCRECGSAYVTAYGDLHLRALGVDCYIGRLDENHLIVKKPSGQVVIDLSVHDRLN